jgi:hypothetical protein
MLPRLKPSPVPPVNAVPEYLAEGDLKADYEDTKTVLQVPWMGVVAMAFASFRNLYGTFWPHFRETFAGRELVEACASLRADAEAAVLALEPPSAVARLTELGYAPRELEQIRDMIEVFGHGNFPYCFMATMTRLLLEGQELENRQPPVPYSGRHAPDVSVPFLLIEAHHADQPTREHYEDIKRQLGLPFVNTDYRALSRWPSYFALAWGDLRPHVQTAEYEAIVTKIHDGFVAAALTLPNPDGLTAEALKAAAEKDSSGGEAFDVVRLFQWLLPGLIANVAYFRAQLQV